MQEKRQKENRKHPRKFYIIFFYDHHDINYKGVMLSCLNWQVLMRG